MLITKRVRVRVVATNDFRSPGYYIKIHTLFYIQRTYDMREP